MPESRTNGDHQSLPMFILDVLRHDAVEQLDSIVRMLNNTGSIGWRDHWPCDFQAGEVAAALQELVHAGLVRSCRERENSDDLIDVPARELNIARDQHILWFALTPAGRESWNRWEPPTSA